MIQIILIFIDEFIDILNRTEGANRGNTMAIMIDLDCPAFLQGKPIIVDGREPSKIARGELWEGARRVQREKPLETSCGELR